ncbi:MAG: hypothetical protein QW728_07540 [Thermoplasmata archaeon]
MYFILRRKKKESSFPSSGSASSPTNSPQAALSGQNIQTSFVGTGSQTVTTSYPSHQQHATTPYHSPDDAATVNPNAASIEPPPGVQMTSQDSPYLTNNMAPPSGEYPLPPPEEMPPADLPPPDTLSPPQEDSFQTLPRPPEAPKVPNLYAAGYPPPPDVSNLRISNPPSEILSDSLPPPPPDLPPPAETTPPPAKDNIAQPAEGKPEKKKTIGKCFICRGLIKEGLEQVECKCNKTFHRKCAERLGECPFCGRKI